MPRRSLSGKVISSNNNKTIVVEVTRNVRHKLYKKIIKRTDLINKWFLLSAEIGNKKKLIEIL